MDRFKVVLGFVLLVALASCGAPAGPDIQIKNAWARPATHTDMNTSMMGSTSAVFMSIQNKGQEADRLIGAQCTAAQTVEIHESVMENDVMQMHHLPEGLEIPAGGEVLLKPGGYHLMLIGVTRDIEEGERLKVDLQFEKSGTISIEAEVRQP
jgi:copper(I)-binding protein